jgi:hypothetical protein
MVSAPRTVISPRAACGGLGVAAALAALAGGLPHPAQFFHAYLFAALAWLNPALGCLLMGFIHRMTGGAWGRTLAPFFEAGGRMVPWALLFSLPLFFGLNYLFPWAAPHPDEQTRELLAAHPAYFSRPFFIGRGIAYAAIFLGLVRVSRCGPQAAWAGPAGMIVYVLTVYLLSVDWVLSLEPRWYSTGFPVILMASQGLSAFALSLTAALTSALAQHRGQPEKKGTWNDLGNLLLGIILFWAYVSYSQFLIIWSGNLPKQATWYVHRNAGGWHLLLIAVVALNLVAPVFFLLSGRTKTLSRLFAGLTAGVLACQFVYLYWLVLPSFRPHGFAFHWLDAVLPLGIGGLWLFFYLNGIPQSGGSKAHG